MTHLTALPVVVPFVVAALLIATGSVLPRPLQDFLGISTAAAVVAMCVLLAAHSAHQPFAYWLGGWTPRHGVAIGISLSSIPSAPGMAAFAAVMVLAALTYALRYFDAVEGLFHGLMLMFLAAMAGFCLTGDLFNLIVFFELMSTVAYALTAYRIEERAPIQGAINFAITNSIAGYVMFIALGMLYARTGALNMAQIGARARRASRRSARRRGDEPAVHRISHQGGDGAAALLARRRPRRRADARVRSVLRGDGRARRVCRRAPVLGDVRRGCSARTSTHCGRSSSQPG